MSQYGCTVPDICDVSYPLKQKLSTEPPVRVTGLCLTQSFSCEGGEHWSFCPNVFFCANFCSGGAGKACVLLFALICRVWPPSRQLWRDKVHLTMIPCRHQDPKEGQGKGKPLLSGFLTCMRALWVAVWELEAVYLKTCPKLSNDQPQTQSLATLRAGATASLGKGMKKVHHSKTTPSAGCQVFSVGSACKGISCTIVAQHSKSLKRIWFFAGISPAEFSNWDIPLATVGHTIEYH